LKILNSCDWKILTNKQFFLFLSFSRNKNFYDFQKRGERTLCFFGKTFSRLIVQKDYFIVKFFLTKNYFILKIGFIQNLSSIADLLFFLLSNKKKIEKKNF